MEVSITPRGTQMWERSYSKPCSWGFCRTATVTFPGTAGQKLIVFMFGVLFLSPCQKLVSLARSTMGRAQRESNSDILQAHRLGTQKPLRKNEFLAFGKLRISLWEIKQNVL